MEHLQHAVTGLVDTYGYVGLLIVMALGNLGAPIGSELVLPTAGALTATGHLPNIWLTIGVAAFGELVGGTIGYGIGRFGGRPLIDRFGKYVHLTHENLDKTQRFFERYGSFAIFICRFIPVIRGIASIPAGLAEMNLAAFYLWYALGSILFCGALVALGNAFGKHIDTIMPLLHRWGIALGLVAIVVIVVLWLVFRKRSAAVTATGD